MNTLNKKTYRPFLAASLFTATAILLTSWLAVAGPLSHPAQAAPAAQAQIYTPTPGPDGRIIYIVKPGDSLISISLLTGVSKEKLRALNNLSTDTIIAGQPLLLGLAGPPEITITPGPSPTPTPVLPTPSPKPGSGSICVLLFEDQNGDSIRQSDEPAIPNGAISISDRSGAVSLTQATVSGSDPYCFKDVPEGSYNISVAVPSGYNPTTGNSAAVTLKAGDETYLDFGAQKNTVTLAEAPTPAGSGRSPLLLIV
ncbi:MAG TPA: LysM peptidoglycan-binding domain-containing protein, partial [Anaerolineales bacterium]